jgi:hypothetical protein
MTPIVIKTDRTVFVQHSMRVPDDVVAELDREAAAINASRTLVSIVKLDAPLAAGEKLSEARAGYKEFGFRIPAEMRAALRHEAHTLGTTINHLCVTKLQKPLSEAQRQLVDQMAETKHRDVGWHYVPPDATPQHEPRRDAETRG